MRAVAVSIMMVLVAAGSTTPEMPAPTASESGTATATATADAGDKTPPRQQGITTQAGGGSIDVGAQAVEGAHSLSPGPDRSSRPSPVGPVVVEFVRAEACGVLSAGEGFEGLFPCSDAVVRDHSDVCGDSPVVVPTWRRDRASEVAAWTEWVMVADLSCAGGPVPSGDQVLSAFRRLALAPSPLMVQPDADQVLVRMDTIAFTDDTPQVLSTSLLGVDVVFTVSPVAFTWDFGADGGDGAPFTTTSPGHAYPDQDVAYAYRHVGTGQVSLTTTWAATYTVGVDRTVRQVPGTATTTSTSHTFEIRELHTHLVAGTCAQQPHQPRLLNHGPRPGDRGRSPWPRGGSRGPRGGPAATPTTARRARTGLERLVLATAQGC